MKSVRTHDQRKFLLINNWSKALGFISVLHAHEEARADVPWVFFISAIFDNLQTFIESCGAYSGQAIEPRLRQSQPRSHRSFRSLHIKFDCILFVVNVKFKVVISQHFVAISKNLNFNYLGNFAMITIYEYMRENLFTIFHLLGIFNTILLSGQKW